MVPEVISVPVGIHARSALLAWVAALGLALGPVPARAAETYQYDAMGRLTDVAYANGGSLHYAYDSNGNILSVTTSLATGVDAGGPQLSFSLGPVTPNPGRGARDLVFAIPARGHVSLRVFDAMGRLVATLVDRDMPAGRYGEHFVTDRWGAGVNYYRLAMGVRTRSGRMVVLR
jgi:YD repeat-containing protein